MRSTRRKSHSGPNQFRAGDLVIDLVKRTVVRGGATLEIKGLSFELLACLVRSFPELASTREINRAVWGDTVVGSSTLTQRVKLLRESLAGSARHPDYIVTVKGRGYRLAVPVEPIETRARRAGWRLTLPVAGALALLALAAFGLLRWETDNSATIETGSTATLFVLPIGNPGDDVEWSEGLRQEIMDSLRSIEGLSVTPVRELPEVNGARALALESQLVETADGAELISALRDLDSGEVLSRQRAPGAGPGQNPRQVTRSVVQNVTENVPGAGRADHIESERQPDPASYELYLRARYHGAQYARSDLRRGIQLLDRALEIDPMFARAYGLRSGIYSFAGTPSYGWMTPGEAFQHARRDALQALALDPGLVLPNVTLGNILLWHEWNPSAASMAYQRALELNPNSLSAWLSIALLHTALGQYEESLAAIDRAIELAPLQAGVHANAGWRLLGARRYEAALDAARHAQSLDPTLRDAYNIQVWAKIYLGHPEAALELPGEYVSDSLRGYLLAATGQETEARRLLSGMLKARENAYVPSAEIATVLIGLGEFEQALDWLETVVEERSREALFFRSSAVYDPLRDHPRFTALMASVGAWNTVTPDPTP